MSEQKDDISNMQTFDPQGIGKNTVGGESQTKSLGDMKEIQKKLRAEKRAKRKRQERKELIAKALLIAILISSLVIAIDILRTYS